MCIHSPVLGLVGSIFINQVGIICSSILSSVSFFDCWMAPGGRWCCQTMFGTPDVAIVLQLLEDGEPLRVICRILDVPPSVVSRLWRSYKETGECTRRQGKVVHGCQPQCNTVFLSCILVAIT